MEDKIKISLKNKTTSQSYSIKVSPSMKLKEFRNNEELSKDCIFMDKENEIKIKDEEDFEIKEILTENNEIYYIHNLKLFNIYINNNPLEAKKFLLSDLLKDIKEKISYKSQNLRFLNNDCKISLEDEAITKLREIIKDDYKIYLSDENSEEEKKKHYKMKK